jgi:hypothetical protein
MRDPMDYIYFVFGGGLTAFDWTTLLALLVISVIYFVAPAIGYPSSGRGLIFASLWLLLAKFGLALLKSSIIFFEIVENKGTSMGGAKGKFTDEPAMLMLFFLMESGLFVMALVLFVCGLGALRRPLVSPPPLRRDFHDD